MFEAQGPPGTEQKYSSIIDNGGTTMQEDDILIMAASIAWKQQQQQPIEAYEQAFIEQFFPAGIPPELAQFAPEAKEQQEAVMQPQEQVGPQAPQQQPAGPPRG